MIPVNEANLARFESRFSRGEPEACWIWLGHTQFVATGSKKSLPYGLFYAGGGKTVGAHRYAYAAYVGSIPDGLVIDHLCNNVKCVNPGHLEAVTNAENLRRQAARRTVCRSGIHPRVPGKLGRCSICFKEARRRVAKTYRENHPEANRAHCRAARARKRAIRQQEDAA